MNGDVGDNAVSTRQPSEVVAVVVTHNRKELLVRCLSSVLGQTVRVDAVVVVDNASTDGTRQTLQECGLLYDPRVKYVGLEENTGGAGGFYVGIQKAYEDGADRIWLMDDDGNPDKECLGALMDASRRYGAHYVAPDLIDDNGQSHFEKVWRATRTEIVCHRGGPFNGILISRDLVKVVGYPMKKYFIWGDEYEYTNRMRDAGFCLMMCKQAKHYHKSTRYAFSKCPRPYYLARNTLYTLRLSSGVFVSRRVLALQASQTIGKLLLLGLLYGNLQQVRDVVRGVIHGLSDRLKDEQVDCLWWGLND